MTLTPMFLGFALGLLFIIPPGPVSVTLVEVGLHRNRLAGVRSALGVAAGDLVVAGVAAVVVTAGAGLPASVFAALRTGSSLILIGLGLVLLARPGTVEAVAGGLERPGRTLFLMTVLTPTVFGAWVALLASLPFAGGGGAVWFFVIGACLASALWHLGLVAAAGEIGHRLDGGAVEVMARLGGAVMITLGLVTIGF